MTSSHRVGRLQRHEREQKVEQIVNALVECGETRSSRLAEIVGVSRRRVGPLIQAARQSISAEVDQTPIGTRNRLSARLEYLYRQALESYLHAKNNGRLREAADFLRTASDAVAKQARICGIEGLAATVGANNPKVRITFEQFEGAPPAALAAAARLSAASGSTEVPRLTGEVSGDSGGSAMGKGHVVPLRTVEAGNSLRVRKTE